MSRRISIHALRVEGDPRSHARAASVFRKFLSTPSGWRATHDASDRRVWQIFLSTPSGWRATRERSAKAMDIRISIHALRVEGDSLSLSMIQCSGRISIHALRVEGDCLGWEDAAHTLEFLSTPSGWRATRPELAAAAVARISIHALRVEGDGGRAGDKNTNKDFYPRPPGGGRQGLGHDRICYLGISIHALRVEGDSFCFVCSTLSANFYPRPPGGGRLTMRLTVGFGRYFYPRPPGGGRPVRSSPSQSSESAFLSTPSGWRATIQSKRRKPK